MAIGALLGVGAILAVAPAAHSAPKGVAAFFGADGTGGGGQLNSPAGVAAVNHATGDVYVVDKGNNRVQRFSSTGVFELAWGKDAVIAGRAEDTGTGFERCTVAEDCQGRDNSTISNVLGRAPRGGELFEPGGIAIDQADGSVYVTDRQNFRVQKFTADGQFVLAWGKNIVRPGGAGDVPVAPIVVSERQTVAISGPFDSGCTCLAPITGGTFTLTFNGQTTLPIPYDATAAIVDQHLEDDLTNVGPGDVTVTGGPGPGAAWTVDFTGALAGIDHPQMTGNASALLPTGSFATVTTPVTGSTTFPGPAEVCTVAADCQEGVTGTLGGEFATFGSNGAYPSVVPAGNPNAGNVIVPDPGNRRVQEFTSTGQIVRAFGADVDSPSGGVAFEICTVAVNCKIAGASGAGSGQFATNQPTRTAVDSTGAIYTVESTTNFRVQKFTPQVGPPALAPSIFLTGVSNTTPVDIAIGAANNVLVARSSPAGASTCPSGAPSVAERRVNEYTSAGVEIADSPHARCAGIPNSTSSGLAVNTVTGDIYLTSSGTPKIFVLGPSSIPTVSMGVGGVSTHTAQLNGLVNPGGPNTTIGVRTNYHFEYRKVGAPAWTAVSADKDAGNGFAVVPVAATLEELEANTPYEARLVASKPFSGAGNVVTAPEAFSTQVSRPDIDAAYATERGATTAKLNARINPNGSATSYRFEYGTTAAYGSAVPGPDGSAGNGLSSQLFSEALSGLAPATTYHFRVVATNANGTNTTTDRIFTTRAAVSPPDDRVWELVSPADKIGGSGIGPWYAGVGSHGPTGIPASDGDRYASQSYYGASLADGGFSYGSDWTLGERTDAGWINHPAFNRAGGFGAPEFAKLPRIESASQDLSLMAWETNNVPLQIFADQAEAWGAAASNSAGQALREWDSGSWEIFGPLDPSQQVGGGAGAISGSDVADGGGYAVLAGRIRGLTGPGDPTNAAFTGDPSDLVCTSETACNGSIYVDDVSGGLSDDFPGAGLRSLVNVCTGAVGAGRTTIPSVDGSGKIGAAECPAPLAGRNARLISPRGAALGAASGASTHITADGSRLFFMSPDHLNSDNVTPCTGSGVVGTRCPPQLYVRQRNTDGSATTRWISQSAVPGQSASLTAAAVFEGATPDGDKVFFRTASPLTADDPNGGAQTPGGVKSGFPASTSVDLYMYDFSDAPGADPGDGTLTRISAGPTGNGDANVSTDTVASVTSALRAFGEDGQRVYFVTAASLPGVAAPSNGTSTIPGGTVGQSATRNLYAYDSGLPVDRRWRFIAQLPANSPLGVCAARGAKTSANGLTAGRTSLGGQVESSPDGNCVRATADGSFITFFTDGRLTADDPDANSGDVYSYNAVSEELIRISRPQGSVGGDYACVTAGPTAGTRCNGDPIIVGSGGTAPLSVITDASDPGTRTAYFQSASRLVPEDVNNVYDVYQWRDGVLSLISTGAAGAQDALYRGNDRSGRNVYVSTRDALTWQDVDAVLDVYSARVDGGIPQPNPPAVCALLSDGCQAPGGNSSPLPTPTDAPAADGNADEGTRLTLNVSGLSAKARKRAARTGKLELAVRASKASKVSATAKGRVAGRVRQVASGSIELSGTSRATLELHLNRAARRRLASGKDLKLAIQVWSPGTPVRVSRTVRLPGASS